VWITDVLDAEGTALAALIGATYRHLDVSREDEWERVINDLMATHGQIDALINNAGIFRRNKLINTPLDEYGLVMGVNARGVFLGMRAVAPHMLAAGRGSIVNISSLAGLRGAMGAFAYAASKWAVRGMTKTAAVEFARSGVRVNSIHPGLIETPMADQLGGNIAKMSKRTPLGRMAEAAEVARLALFLASDDSSYSTGSEFIIDGGLNAL